MPTNITPSPNHVTYQLIKCMGRPYQQHAVIDSIDISALSLLQLSQDYYDIYFILKVNLYEGNKVLFFKDLPVEVQISPLTFEQYLRSLETRSLLLTLSNDLPKHVRGEVYAWDVISFGFDYKAVKEGYHPESPLPDEDKTDLLLTKPGVNYSEAASHSLIAINGLFHYHDYTDGGWLIHGGNITRRKRPNNTHLNLLDFTTVGKLKLYRIKKEMISPLKNGIPLHQGFYLDLEESAQDKTIGISIGGYLHLLDRTYKRVGTNRIRVNFANVQWETLYYKLKQLIQLKDFSITDFGNDRVLGFELYHDSTIEALLALPQTFIFTINNPHVNVYEEPIGHIGIPGRYESAIPPVYPLRIGEGRYPAYKAIKDKDKWVLAVDDNIVPIQVRYNKPHDKFHIIHDRKLPINNEVYATATYMRILSDKDITVRLLDDLLADTPHVWGDMVSFIREMELDDLGYIKDEPIDYYEPKPIVHVNLEDDYFKPQLPFNMK